MTVIQIDQFNYEHLGNTHPHAHRGDTHGFGYNLDGLAREFSVGESPDFLVMCEGDRGELNGGEAGWEAAHVLRGVTGRPYIPLFASLSHEDGMFAPIIFIDPNTIHVRRWYYHRLPDFAERNRNQVVFTTPGNDEEVELIAVHWHPHDNDARVPQARELCRGSRGVRRIAVGDFNCTPSGPHWEAGDFNTPGHLVPHSRWAKAEFRHGRAQAGPWSEDVRALDLLLGWWDPDAGRRVGDVGWFDAAELEGVHTPTQYERPNGRVPRAVDRIVFTKPLKDTLVPGSYRVFEADETAGPRCSDHKRISARFDV